MMIDIINNNEIQSIIRYWIRRYYFKCTQDTLEDMHQAMYINIIDTINKYPDKSLNELYKLISLSVKWSICNYFNYQSKHNNLIYTDKDYTNGINNIDDMVYIHQVYNKLDNRTQFILSKQHEGYTLKEIGLMLNISKQRALQLIKNIPNSLYNHL